MEPKKGGILNQGDTMKNAGGQPTERTIIPAKPDVKERPDQKENMDNLFSIAGQQREETRNKMKSAVNKSRPDEEAVSKLNNQLSGGKGGEIEKELEDMEKFSEEDIRLAEELLFNGFCVKTDKITSKISATFYSMNADEMEMIQYLMFEFTKKYETKTGMLDVSQKTVDAMNQLYILSVSFKGYNDVDIAPSKTVSLDILKSAFKKLSDLEIEGDLENHKNLTEEIKKVMKIRASYIKKLPATVVDILSAKRFAFEQVLYKILEKGDLYPKS